MWCYTVLRSNVANIIRYMLLPLAVRSFSKIEKIIDDEMSAAGASKVSMPLLLNNELWKKSVCLYIIMNLFSMLLCKT